MKTIVSSEFDARDSDKDGKISKDEHTVSFFCDWIIQKRYYTSIRWNFYFQKFELRRFGAEGADNEKALASVEASFDTMDTDKDGSVSFDEFTVYIVGEEDLNSGIDRLLEIIVR